MKLRSMEEKISYRLFLMGFLGLIFTAALCIFVFHKAFTAQAWSGLERETDLVRAGYEQTGDPAQLSAFVTDDLRVTLISQDGSVLFESATDQPMENHLTRPEIRDAIANGEGRDIRDSQTMGYETYYYALRLSGGDVLRVAQDAETVWSIYDATIPAIVLSCVALMLAAAVLAALLTKALVQPVLNMTEDLDHIQENVPYRELIPFAESIHSDRILRENNEKMRQEFTANVSHELKTPLTSISGYAELIETGIAKPEDVPDFGRKIHSEATRMIQLVNDILQLSKLDTVSETGDAPVMETVDLLEVVKECVERQKLNARRAYISLTYLGESAPVLGSRALLDELCQNLCDNAIRYNRPGGKVQIITTCSRDGHCSLTVTDNGIGIPREAQSSVFERFYRVDKSRSKAWSCHRQAHCPYPQRPHQAGKSGRRWYHHHCHLSYRLLIQHEMHVCPQLRAGVFCWVKACAAAIPQRCPGLQVQRIHALLPAALQKRGALCRELLLLRLRGQRAVGGALAIQPHKHLRLLQGD